MPERFIPAHGGYRKLLSYQRAEIVYDATVRFCRRFMNRYDRTVDQMVQAARSGKQNIIEGSVASGTSKKMEIKLTNVARASLEELLADYRDFLRLRGLAEWSADSEPVRRLRGLIRLPDAGYESLKAELEHPDPGVAANTIIGLIKVTTYLLDRQIAQLEKAFSAAAIRAVTGREEPDPTRTNSGPPKPRPGPQGGHPRAGGRGSTQSRIRSPGISGT